MRVDDCASVAPIDVDIAMKTPLRRRQSRPACCATERHRDNVFRPHRFVSKAGRRNQETRFGPRTDIAGLAAIDAAFVHSNRGRDDLSAQGELAHARRSGNIAARPSAVARQMPRSVMSPVRSRAGVTIRLAFVARAAYYRGHQGKPPTGWSAETLRH